MSLPENDRTERNAQALGDVLRAASESAEAARRTSMPARRRDMATRQNLVAAIRVAPGRKSWVMGFAFAAIVACVAFLFLRDRPLGYAIDGREDHAGDGGYVRADGHSKAVRFDEGSTFSFGAGSAGRVGDVSGHGAAIILEDGVLEASVVHRSGAKWSAHAGPWVVEVTGTRFDITWDPRARALQVDLIEGKVVVRGPGAEDGIGLHAGQTLRARDGDGIVVTSLERAAAALSPGSAPASGGSSPALPGAASGAPSGSSSDAEPASPSASAAVPSASAPAPTAGPDASGGHTAVGDKSSTSWTELVAKGKHDVVLAEARKRGVPSVIASAAAADLLALADAARYGGDSGTASGALRALRDRFAGTKAATDAAFFLGRMADDGGSSAAAIRWYDAHIAEGGSFAAEALGRKMIAVRRASGDAAARAVAQQYLARYPKGPHASVARALIGGDVADGGTSPR